MISDLEIEPGGQASAPYEGDGVILMPTNVLILFALLTGCSTKDKIHAPISDKPATTPISAASAPKASEQALVAMAQVTYDTWLKEDARCAGGWAWKGLKPLKRDGCVDTSMVSHLAVEDGQVIDVTQPDNTVFRALRMPEEHNARGMVRDIHGVPLMSYTDGHGRSPVTESLGWLGDRGLGLRTIKDGKQATYASYSGIERIFHNVLSGRTETHDFWEELDRRWKMEPRQAGADVILTLDLAAQEALADEAAREALALITEASATPSMMAWRMQTEGRKCLAYDVSAVQTDLDGSIRAAVTAVGYLDEGGHPQVRFETGRDYDRCIGPFTGALRAFSDPELVGSTWKIAVWSEALTGALRGAPSPRFAQGGEGKLYLLDPGDPQNGDGTYFVDHGVLEQVMGRKIWGGCSNHHEEGAEAPAYGVIGVQELIGRSVNTEACYVAALVGGERLQRAASLLQLDGPIDLFPGGTGDRAVDASLLPDPGAGLIALGGRLDVLDDGAISFDEAAKLGVGKRASLTALGLNNLTRVVAAGGVYHPPHLLRAIRFVDGREILAPTPTPTVVFETAAAAWVQSGMEGSVAFGTSSRAMADLAAMQKEHLAVKTGTPDRTDAKGRSLASHKVEVGIYGGGSPHPVVLSVWARNAEGLDKSRGALHVIRGLVADGWLDTDAVRTAAR